MDKENIRCIYCDSETSKHGKSNDKQRYLCLSCNKLFNSDTLKRIIERNEKYEKIKKMYLDDNLSTIEIGNILGVSSTVPQRILKSMGITKSISEANSGKKRGTKLPTYKIIDLYTSGLSSIKIAEEVNCTKSSVLKILRENNIERDNKYEFINKKTDIIIDLYLARISMLEISKKINMSYTNINRILHKFKLVRTEDRFHLGIDYDEYIKTLSVYKKYVSDVKKVTNKQKITKLLNYDKRGISGINGVYHLDHKYSIIEGFKNNVDSDIIGNINNLEFIPWRDNIIKGSKCSITLEELLLRVKTI